MNYLKIYADLIDRAMDRIVEGYTETHHILPRCLSGPDTQDNLVRLTAKEHYLAHLLLHKAYPECTALLKAVNSFCTRPDIINSNSYQTVRIKFSEYMKGNTENSNRLRKICIGLVWINNGEKSIRVPKDKLESFIADGYFLGRIFFKRMAHSLEHRLKISKRALGRRLSQETKDKISESTKGKSYFERYGEDAAKIHIDKLIQSRTTKRRISFHGKIFTNLADIQSEFGITKSQVRTKLSGSLHPDCFYMDPE